jgi:hypothetical protein
MAILKLGVFVVGIRGTIGGITFSANKAGPYAKMWARPPRTTTILQSQHRADLSVLGAAWRALTQIQRDAWDTYAAAAPQILTNSLGETYTISGFGWFTKTNMNQFLLGRPLTTAAPVVARPAAPTVTAFTVSAVGASTISYVGGEWPAGDKFVVFFTYSLSQAAVNISLGRRFIVASTAPTANPLVISASFLTDHYGIPIKLSRWEVELFHQQPDGQRGAGTKFQSNVSP